MNLGFAANLKFYYLPLIVSYVICDIITSLHILSYIHVYAYISSHKIKCNYGVSASKLTPFDFSRK